MSIEGKHTIMAGTSMAAAHATGAVALLLGADPSLTASQIKTLLTETAGSDLFTGGVPNSRWGYGKLDVLEAVAKSIDPQATTTRKICSYDQPGVNILWRLTGASRYALRFTPPDSGQVTGFQMLIATQDQHPISGSGMLECEIDTTGGGSPGGRIGKAVQVPLATLSPGTDNTVSLLAANARVRAGTDYYLILTLSSPGDSLTVSSDSADDGTRSMVYNGSEWTTSHRNFRVRPIVVTATGNFSEGGNSRPVAFELRQNFPNPFNLTTEINYSIPVRGHVTLKVFDILGREVATLVDQDENAGSHYAAWGATGVSGNIASSGVYFYRLESGGMKKTMKMILLK